MTARIVEDFIARLRADDPKGLWHPAYAEMMAPSIQWRTAPIGDDAEAPVSRFGGHPNLPPDMLWPRSCAPSANGRQRPMSFVAQLDLGDLAALAARPDCEVEDLALLPQTGMLFFFIDEQGLLEWSGLPDELHALVVHAEPSPRGAVVRPPADFHATFRPSHEDSFRPLQQSSNIPDADRAALLAKAARSSGKAWIADADFPADSFLPCRATPFLSVSFPDVDFTVRDEDPGFERSVCIGLEARAWLCDALADLHGVERPSVADRRREDVGKHQSLGIPGGAGMTNWPVGTPPVTHTGPAYLGFLQDKNIAHNFALLLQLDSESAPHNMMTWGDCGKIHFFVRRYSLEQGAFNPVFAYIDCG